jgi:hypothetical protein
MNPLGLKGWKQVKIVKCDKAITTHTRWEGDQPVIYLNAEWASGLSNDHLGQVIKHEIHHLKMQESHHVDYKEEMNKILKERLPDSIDTTKLRTWTRKSRISDEIEWPEMEEETPPPVPKVCECGAKFTSNPNHHMSWCPMKED